MDIETFITKAKDLGFDEACELNMAALDFMPQVRDMCAAGRCRAYGHSWSCPPAIGTIEEAVERASHYGKGVLVQSIGQLEDEFDVETMMETEALQKERFAKLTAWMREDLSEDCLPMAAGTCTVCKKCTYPDEPCRFPNKAIPSMEGYGLWVSKVCEQSGMKYNYGKNTIAYTSCILF